jgi:hypothetical protein
MYVFILSENSLFLSVSNVAELGSVASLKSLANSSTTSELERLPSIRALPFLALQTLFFHVFQKDAEFFDASAVCSSSEIDLLLLLSLACLIAILYTFFSLFFFSKI